MNQMTVIGADTSTEFEMIDLKQDHKTQMYYGRGKLLLSGEYLVLDGARALAVPLKVGQSLSVTYSPSFSPALTWKSFDHKGELWLEARFEFWRFNCLDPDPSPEVLELQKILRAARKLNTHFLREENDVFVETRLGFPLEWGLGSSSSLLYNIAQWAYVSPFQLQFMTFGGSGYDVACAQSEGPILYSLDASGPHWSPILFDPSFKNQLSLIYLGQKQNSREAVARYQDCRERLSPDLIARVSHLTERMLEAQTREEFEALMREHEEALSFVLDLPPLKMRMFADFDGEMKSLGAWGGDFALVSSAQSFEQVQAYFHGRGYDVVLPYTALVQSVAQEEGNGTFH